MSGRRRSQPPWRQSVVASEEFSFLAPNLAVLGDFGFAIAFDDRGAIISVTGEVDGGTAPTLAWILRALADAGHARVVLDLGQVTFFGGSGLGLVSVASLRLDSVGGTLTIRGASTAVRRMFALPGIGVAAGVTFSSAPHSDLGAEQQIGDRTEILASPQSLRSDLIGSVATLTTTKVIDAALQMVTMLATATVDGADGVSVTLARGGHMVTVASSNDTVLRMDEHQYRTGEGPCLAAASQGHWFHVESLAEEQRWPDFVPLAIDEGIASVLSTPLLVAERPLGALNIYSTTDRAFGLMQQELAALFATQAATILTNAGVDLLNADFATRISKALLAREVIAHAQGVLMARYRVDRGEAAAKLHRAARSARISVVAHATDVVASTHDDVDPGS